MKTTKLLALVLVFPFLMLVSARVHGQDSGSQPTPTQTLDQEKQQLEMEKLELENEKLKLELEREKLQMTATPAPTTGAQNPSQGKTKNEAEKEANDYQAEMTQKAEAIAKEHKENADIVVVDFANSEIWHKGVRYSLHQLYDMAEDNRYAMDKTLAQMDPAGDSQYRYQFKNLSLLRYETKKRGIVEITAPSKDGDFKMMSPEGFTLDAGISDIRNAYHNVYFIYDGEAHEGRLKILKYIHKVDLDFSDRLNFEFDKDGKLVRIRYGVLDEH